MLSNIIRFDILPEALTTPIEGNWGNIHWRLDPKIDSSTGDVVQNESKLSITGSGNMPQLLRTTPPPWEVALKGYDLGGAYRLNIAEGIMSIGTYMFEYATLEGNLPSSLNRIGRNAFYFCTFPSELRIPANVKVIQQRAFLYSNPGGETGQLVLNPELEIISEGAFEGSNFYGDLILPEGLKEIEKFAFHRANSLGTIHIPRSVTKIGSFAFYKTNMGYPGKNNIVNKSSIKMSDLLINPLYTMGLQTTIPGGGWPASKWEKIKSSWYYLNEASGADNGMMLSNTQINGWKLGADGAWIP